MMVPSDGIEYEDTDAEEGVDQLYSESEDEANTSKKPSASKGKGRPVGQTILPQQRLENIIQNDGVTGNLALSKEALFVVSLATEEFIKRLAQAGRQQADADRRNLIHYRDMSMATQQYQEFMFLRDTIPCPIPLYEALQLREAKEIETREEDPAMIHAPSVAPSVAHSDDLNSISHASKIRSSKKPSQQTNGRSNGSSSSRQEPYEATTTRPTPLRETISEGASRTGSVEASSLAPEWVADRSHSSSSRPRAERSPSVSQNGSTKVNGHDLAYISRSQTATPIPSRDELSKPPSPPYEPRTYNQLLGPGQPPPLAGPASGFLQDPNGPFVRGSSIPGRTIYSQQRSPQ